MKRCFSRVFLISWRTLSNSLIRIRSWRQRRKRLRNCLNLKYKKTGERKSAGKVVLGTVAGDIHDIGKNIVGAISP